MIQYKNLELYDIPNIKLLIENNVKDLVSSFLYYDRQEDEDLPAGAIEYAIKTGKITNEDIITIFSNELKSYTT